MLSSSESRKDGSSTRKPESLLKTYLLETFNFNADHTGDNVAQELHRVVEKWGGFNVSCCVTDNASNVLLGMEKTGWNHLPCFAHTLNLVVQHTIKNDFVVSEIKEKCKAIVAHFNCSTKSSEKLRTVQQQL